METVLIIVIGVLVIAGLLYLGRRRSERMREERALRREKQRAEARGHREMAAEFLERHYERFFTMYASLLDSPNYVTRRQSLKLLGELLVNRSNYAVMIRFVADEENLKRAMNALRDKSKNIQFEAFHVFKVRCVGTC